MNSQHSFQKDVPKGNYSGLTWLGGERYAIVSDKAPQSGFFIFRIQFDSINGDIINIRTEGFRSSGVKNHDEEDIAFFPKDSTVFISRESDNKIMEYSLVGQLTGRELLIPPVFNDATTQYGFEALTYNKMTHRFWSTSESTLKGDGKQADSKNSVRNKLRIQSFNDSLQPMEQYIYLMDTPKSHASASVFAMGVPAIVALDNAKLLILEREFAVKPGKIGSYVINKIYAVDPSTEEPIHMDLPLPSTPPYMKKHLIVEWKTSLSLFRQDLANYEGMCLGPKLVDGNQVIILCADSQDQYKGILQDWFKTIVISPK